MHLWRSLILLLLSTVAPAQVAVRAAGPEVRDAALRAVERLTARGIERLAPDFPGTPTGVVRVVVHADPTTVPEQHAEALHPGVPGFALLQEDEIHLVLSQIRPDPPNDLRTTIEHELVHVLLDQFAGPAGPYVPRWLHEGLAQDLSGGVYLGVQEEDLVYRLRMRNYLDFPSLVESFPHHSPGALALAYGQSFSFVAFLRNRVGQRVLLQVVRQCGPELPFETAFARHTRKSIVEYEEQWREYVLLESGAGYRLVMNNCFMILILAIGGPLLALALARRRNREEAIKQDMADDPYEVAGVAPVEVAGVLEDEAEEWGEWEDGDDREEWDEEWDEGYGEEYEEEYDEWDGDWSIEIEDVGDDEVEAEEEPPPKG